jgi:RND family efflux transporter MFP subunit
MKSLRESPDRFTPGPVTGPAYGDQLREDLPSVADPPAGPPPPTGARQRWWLVVGLVIVLLALLLAGIVPRLNEHAALKAEANAVKTSLPKVPVVPVRRAPEVTNLALPGTTRGYQETAIYPRTNGYVKRYLVEIGQPVMAGQLLAEIEAPDVDKQKGQAVGTLSQSQANLGQARANLELARVSTERWQRLLQRNAVSKQEADTYRLQFEARQADVVAAEATVKANLENLRRLTYLQSFQKITAPFDGIVTARNVDVGALVTDGTGADSQGTVFASHELFRVAQTHTLRVYVNVPQTFVASIQVGQTAQVIVRDLPQRTFLGTVVRTAGAVDPASRTLLTEVDVANPDHVLLPGLYAEVKFDMVRATPPFLIPTSALIVRPAGQYVAVVDQDSIIRFRMVGLGRDYGREIEIIAGLEGNETVVSNPTDDVREGAKIEPVSPKPPAGTSPMQPPDSTKSGEPKKGET